MLLQLYTSLMASFAEYEHARTVAWARTVESSSESKLRLTLLRKSEDNPPVLFVNFSPDLVRLLREVKYFIQLGLNVPEAALAVYRRAETYRKHVGNLELIVNMCNAMESSIISVERPLLKVRAHEGDFISSLLFCFRFEFGPHAVRL